MPHVLVHALTALPALYFGEPLIALGCVVPDVGWLKVEWRLRRSNLPPQVFIEQHVTDADCIPYRATHSLLLWSFGALACPPLALGAVLHITLDLFTHRGKMAQRPLWPVSQWRWPWALKK